MLPILLFSCIDDDRPTPGDRSPPDVTTPVSSPTTTTPPEPQPVVPDVPMLDEALAERCPDPTPRGSVLPPGDGLHRVTLDGATGRCNDGSPPVLYVRPATDPAHATDWVLFLEGGLYCDHYEDCAIRWCGEGYYDVSKMSSRWAPMTRDGRGIASADPANAFHGWNQVELYYCSSDNWSGSRADAVFDDGEPSYRLHFEGADIVMDTLAALADAPVSDDGLAEMPSLDQARTLVLSGSSAGGTGTASNLDRVADALPDVEVIGLVDAIFYIDQDILDPVTAAAHGAWSLDDRTRKAEAWGQVVDASCAAALDEMACTEHGLVLRDHVTTPFLAHHDLFDEVIYDGLYGESVPRDKYLRAVLDTAARWEANGVGSVMLTGCGEHQYLPVDERFFLYTTADDLGRPWTLHDLAVAYVTGADRSLYVADDIGGSQSSCP